MHTVHGDGCAPLTQPGLFAALKAIPAEDWGRNWAASRTMMMRRTSKTVQEAVDKLRLPAVVCVRTCGSVHWEPQFICCQLASLTALVSITTLDLQDFLYYKIKTPRLYFWLAEVLARCPALERLNLRSNMIGDCGTERLAGALAQCTVLAHLNFSRNQLRAAGLLTHCTELVYLDLSCNHIGPDGAASLSGCRFY